MYRDSSSIEEVLNSRCSSDSGPKKRHFGTLTNKPPSEETIKNILNCLNIPRFSDGKLLHRFENGYLFLGFENSKDLQTQRLLHIECGMQQEAIYLACAVEGVGTCIHSQGINGTQKGETTSTARHLITEMTDPYSPGKLTTKAPGPHKPFIPGKYLTEPLREGEIECLPELSKLAAFKKFGSSATDRDTSQLLWAARGRTPHCVEIQKWRFMWGLTIPQWSGNCTSVYLLRDGKLYSYVNWTTDFSLMNRLFREKLRWTRGNPTHDIRFVTNLRVESSVVGHSKSIILCLNEHSGRALWETGYMLENIFLQARSLDVAYESKIFSADEASQLNEQGVPNAIASVFI